MKRAFTLVELLVVIGIIGILSGILLSSFSGSSESARAVVCLSNLRNLAVAWQGGSAYSSETRKQSAAMKGMTLVKSGGYYENPGWIGSDTKGLYPADDQQSFNPIGMYETDVDKVQYALRNGWMYKALGGAESTYVCPSHRKAMKGKATPHWSYFMNPKGMSKDGGMVKIGSKLEGADHVLLFAEIPFDRKGPGGWFPDGKGGDWETDAVIQYTGFKATPSKGKTMSGTENIGANHKSGKLLVAHVVFADGHVEKLRVSGTKGRVMSGSELRELTEWLCEGEDVSFNGSAYEKLTE